MWNSAVVTSPEKGSASLLNADQDQQRSLKHAAQQLGAARQKKAALVSFFPALIPRQEREHIGRSPSKADSHGRSFTFRGGWKASTNPMPNILRDSVSRHLV